MKNLKSVLLLVFIVNSFFSYSQGNYIKTTIIEPIQKDALYREKVFLHLNKSVYFTNDNVWFTAYVSNDFDNSPSDYTTNLKVNLYNDKGVLIKSRNVFIHKGLGIGDFLIDDTFSGKYYIQASTNFMKNFGFENTFIQEIEIINPVITKKNKQENYTNNYDIQFFPESGYLLENAENIVGIKVLINGKGYPFFGKIIDSKGNEITSFKGNLFGMSNFKFIYSKNEIYKALVTIKDTVQKINLPKAKKTGVIFTLDNFSNKDKIKLTLKTNKASIPSLRKDSLALLFYRNNTISEAVTFSLNNSDVTSQELFFDKSKMLHGVNTITLFKNNKPVAERKFFIYRPNEQTAILVDKLKSINDSIGFKIKTIDSKFKPVISQLSISVLPKNAKNFKENQTIKSAFLLTPYIKGVVENPSFYFKNSNPDEMKYLDLMLLCQGWTTYSLEEKIKELNPKEKDTFEWGFTLNGNVKKAPKGYGIGIISKKNSIATFSNLNENRAFSFKNVFAYKNDSVKIAFIKKNAPLVKPNGVLFSETQIDNSYKLTTINNTKSFFEEKISVDKEKKSIHYPNVELLDEVVLKNVKSKKKLTIYDVEMDLALKHNLIAPAFYKKVTIQMGETYQTAFQYFKNLGFIKQGGYGTFMSLRNAPVTFSFTQGYEEDKNPDGTFRPRVYLDDVSVDLTGDFNMLSELNMKDVDVILINKSGAGGGMNAGGGIIKIYRKKGNYQYFEKVEENLYEKLILQTGFDKATNYYKPQYNIYSKEAYNWTEIDWKNTLQTNENGEVFIKIPTNEISNEFKFIINGFSENGLLFNTIFNTGLPDF